MKRNRGGREGGRTQRGPHNGPLTRKPLLLLSGGGAGSRVNASALAFLTSPARPLFLSPSAWPRVTCTREKAEW